MDNPKRTIQVNIRLNDEEERTFKIVAKHLGLNVPNMIRAVVRAEELNIREKKLDGH